MDNPGMPAVGAFRVANPGGAEELELFPAQMFFWTNNLGEYILSDDPGFDPNIGS